MKAPKSTIITIITLTILACTIHFLTVQASTETTTIPKPSIPEFTLKYVDNSYDVPPITTTTTNPYTGEQTTTTKPGYTEKEETIEITIKNQEFTPYTIDNQQISLFYYISRKGHYTEEWGYYPSLTHNRYYTANHIYQSNSDYTIVELNAPPEGEIDFRVQAQSGYYSSVKEYFGVPGAPFTTYTFNGEVSGWSETQTITMPSSLPSPSPPIEPTATPIVTEAIIGATIIIALLGVGIGFFLYLMKKK